MVNYSSRVKSSLPAIFVNHILLEHTYCLQLLSHDMAELSNWGRDNMGDSQSQKYLLSGRF